MIKIAILGSTGSIGLTALNIVRKNKKNFKIILLSTNSNVNRVFNQAKEFKVKNIIITGKKINNSWKKKFKKNSINIFYDFKNFKLILKNKLDYTLNSISGIDGLEPTINIIKFTKKIAIANKEAIICGWNLINKELIKNKTKFIPVDSEHFSIFKLINNENKQLINKIIITASGGPFLNKKDNFKKIKIKDALNHPNWKMGKKISIDSANLMNKVFEVIEACKIFNFSKNKYRIVIHPQSYVHSIVRFKNGLIKMILYNTDMKIPISNTLYEKKNSILKIKRLKVKINVIKNLLKKYKIKKINCLKIDTEGYEKTILIDFFKNINNRIYPKFLIIEHNNDQNYNKIDNLILRKGYEIIFTTNSNAIYRRNNEKS